MGWANLPIRRGKAARLGQKTIQGAPECQQERRGLYLGLPIGRLIQPKSMKDDLTPKDETAMRGAPIGAREREFRERVFASGIRQAYEAGRSYREYPRRDPARLKAVRTRAVQHNPPDKTSTGR